MWGRHSCGRYPSGGIGPDRGRVTQRQRNETMNRTRKIWLGLLAWALTAFPGLCLKLAEGIRITLP
jgi:hypothetical protein